MPGNTGPSIHPTLNVRTSGSLRTIFEPSAGSEDDAFGREYAVEAIRYDCEEDAFAESGSCDMWNRAFMFVCRCRCDNCRVPCKAIVKGVQRLLSALVPPDSGSKDVIPSSS